MTALPWQLLVASTAVPGLALVATRLLARASADVRHRVLVAGLLALLLVPAMLLAPPAWTVAVLPAAVPGAPGTAPDPVGAGAPWLAWVWLAGALTGLAHLAAGWLALLGARRRGTSASDPAWTALAHGLARRLGIRRPVDVRLDAGVATPMTWGTLRPVIALPRTADLWTRGRRETVLAHELAHVARRDALVTLLVQAVCALYWFQPLVWVARRRLRLEQEIASDDLVLAAGGKPSAYAGHLLELARERRRPAALDAALAVIGRPSQLEQRLRSVLAPAAARRRGAVPAWALAGALAFGAAGTGLERAPAPASPSPLPAAEPVAVQAPRERVADPEPAAKPESEPTEPALVEAAPPPPAEAPVLPPPAQPEEPSAGTRRSSRSFSRSYSWGFATGSARSSASARSGSR